ncbi:hypothetical protein BGW38_002228 [Lunasporangiospora selenospora]|uniref:Uncharacterized protein n=1 Tax=Lunasporangiospora selenospora TaxID=979761 RepID=A0A9P6KDN7_9FUNG|nr:hypothetical protein BGW38_002228 [Lunasporangiospora selenospora]
MYMRSLITFVLVALCAMSALAAPPPPQATDILQVTIPKTGAIYKVGDYIPVHVKLVNGTSSEIYKKNPKIRLTIQKAVRLPLLNVRLGEVRARTLAKDGFKFLAKKEYLIKEQPTAKFRVRASFDTPRGGYVDSGRFDIKPKK